MRFPRHFKVVLMLKPPKMGHIETYWAILYHRYPHFSSSKLIQAARLCWIETYILSSGQIQCWMMVPEFENMVEILWIHHPAAWKTVGGCPTSGPADQFLNIIQGRSFPGPTRESETQAGFLSWIWNEILMDFHGFSLPPLMSQIPGGSQTDIHPLPPVHKECSSKNKMS